MSGLVLPLVKGQGTLIDDARSNVTLEKVEARLPGLGFPW